MVLDFGLVGKFVKPDQRILSATLALIAFLNDRDTNIRPAMCGMPAVASAQRSQNNMLLLYGLSANATSHCGSTFS